MRLAPAVLLAMGVSWPALAANFNVANDGDLRSAISSAKSGDTITFSNDITLSSNLPAVTQNVTFNGGNHTLSGINQYRGLFVTSGTVAINDLTITQAIAQGGKGGDGKAGGAGGGGAGLGGALFIDADAHVTVSNVILQNGAARGGNGGRSFGGFNSGSGGGGGYGITGADGGNGNITSGGGGTPTGGNGFVNSNGGNGGFGGGGGGSASGFGGSGGFGGGGGGGSGATTMPGGFLGGTGGAGLAGVGGGGGGGGGLGGAIFVRPGGTLSLAGSLTVSGNTVAGGSGGAGGGTIARSGAGAGSGLFLGGNGTLSLTPGAGQTQTIGDAIVDQTGTGGTGPNAGSWALVKDGAGTTVLTGANAYSGGTTVKAGVLQGSTAGLEGNILNNASVVFDQAGAGTYAGNMSGTGALTVRGSGAVTFSGTNTYSGATTVSNGGTLLFTTDANLGAAGNGINLNNGTIGVGSGAGGQTFGRAVAITSTGGMFVGDNVASPVTWSGVIGGAGKLVKSGLGQLILSGVNTYSGGTVVSGGTLSFTSDANLGAAGAEITLEGGSIGTTKDAFAGLSMTRHITLVGSGGITLGINPLTWNGNITGDGRFIKSGLGVLTLAGLTNTYTGGTMVTQGTLQIASDDKLGKAGTAVTLIQGGGLWASGTFSTARPITLLNGGGTFQVSDGQTLTLTGELNGNPDSPFTKVGAGTLVLAGTSTYGGNIIQNGGTVQGNTSTLRNNIVFDTNAQNTITRSVTFDQATDGTFAGNITGIGSLTKTGAGTLILSGGNNYSTGTTVSAGTLQGTSKSLQGAIANNAAVIFDQDFAGTYAGDMTGSGTLTKNGTGKLSFTGTSSVGGGTTINAGAFAVNGQLTSNVTVNKGGTLNGVGHINGDITNNGGEIGPGNSIGHLTVNGNFTFNSGTYEVEVDPQGDSDRVSVIGAGHAVRINTGTLLVVPHPGTYTPNTKYTIITTEAGGNVWVGDLAGGVGFLKPEASLDPDLHSIYLTLALAPDAFRSAGRTANQQAVGGALDAAAADGNVGGIVTTMANLQPSQGAAALQALSGQPYADFGTVNLQASQLFMNAVGRQMAAKRGTGLGAPSSVALAEACQAACDVDAATPSRFSAWLGGIGSTGSVGGDGNAADLSYTLGGTAFGVDYRLDPRILLGIAGGYVGGTQWVDGFRGDGHTDALSVALYGSFTQGAFYTDVLAGYANASNDMRRRVTLPGMETGSASGDTSADQFLGQVETGYKIGLGLPADTSVTPFGRLQIGSVHQDSFTESGQDSFNLDVASQTTTSVRTTFGADLAASVDLGGGSPLGLGLRLGWMHEFADTDRPITAAFDDAPGSRFTVSGASVARDSAVIGFSAAAGIADNTSLAVSYDGEVGGNTDNHQIRAVLRRTW